MCDRGDGFDEPDEEDAFEFGYDTFMDFWYDKDDFECIDIGYFVKELEYDLFKECEDVYEDFDDDEDLIDSCMEGMQEAIGEMEDYCD
jgi:hypothetical protein